MSVVFVFSFVFFFAFVCVVFSFVLFPSWYILKRFTVAEHGMQLVYNISGLSVSFLPSFRHRYRFWNHKSKHSHHAVLFSAPQCLIISIRVGFVYIAAQSYFIISTVCTILHNVKRILNTRTLLKHIKRINVKYRFR